MKTTGKSLDEATDHIASLDRDNLSIAPPAIPLQADQMWTDFPKTQYEFNQKLVELLERIEQRKIERD